PFGPSAGNPTPGRQFGRPAWGTPCLPVPIALPLVRIFSTEQLASGPNRSLERYAYIVPAAGAPPRAPHGPPSPLDAPDQVDPHVPTVRARVRALHRASPCLPSPLPRGRARARGALRPPP